MNLKDFAAVVGLQKQIEILKDKLQAAREAAEKTTASYSLAPGSSGDGCRLENSVVDIVYYENLIEEKEALLRVEKKQLRDFINDCEDPCVSAALTMRYDISTNEIQPSWTAVAKKLKGVSPDSIRMACVRYVEKKK